MKYSVGDLLAAIEWQCGEQVRARCAERAARIELDRRVEANQNATDEAIERSSGLNRLGTMEARKQRMREQERITLLFAKHKKLMAEYEALP